MRKKSVTHSFHKSEFDTDL